MATTPEEKAKELVEKFAEFSYVSWMGGNDEMTTEEAAKQCAIILCYEVISTLDGVWADVAGSIARSCEHTIAHREYWQKVKEHIEQL